MGQGKSAKQPPVAASGKSRARAASSSKVRDDSSSVDTEESNEESRATRRVNSRVGGPEKPTAPKKVAFQSKPQVIKEQTSSSKSQVQPKPKTASDGI